MSKATLSKSATLSPTLFGIVDHAVERSIRLFMKLNLRDCLGDNYEVVEQTPTEIQKLFLDCEYYLQQAKTNIDYKLDGGNVFTGRYMLWNNYGEHMLMIGNKEELIAWVTQCIPEHIITKEVKKDDPELFAWVWLAYLTTNYEKVVEYYNNEKELIKKQYISG